MRRGRGQLLWCLLAAVARNGASVASNPETTFSISVFCCETFVAASSLSFLYLLPSCPFSPVQALAAPVERQGRKVSRPGKGMAAYAQILCKMYMQWEGGMPVLHIHLLSFLEANPALLSVL